jgi:AIR synthase related protein, N-terminal domain
MKGYRFSSRQICTSRDILLLRVHGDRTLAISCDAAGGIGSKQHDNVRVNPRMVGKMTARVALMELLAIGANPIALSGTFSVEPNPTANLVMQGIKEELRNARLTGLRILCSSEKNFKVSQTGIGITAMGLVSDSHIKIGKCEQGDDIVAVGEPCVGREVISAEKDERIADTLDVIKLRKSPFVHELIAVGSKGILYEATAMAEGSGLFFEASIPERVNLKKSAGPATVLLSAIRKDSFSRTRRLTGAKPTRKIGTLRRR